VDFESGKPAGIGTVLPPILKAVRSGAALLIVADIDQLPSVGPGQVLADVFGSGAVPVIRLTKVFRPAPESKIITMARALNSGRYWT
jgi:exodeoxyribonuclease V alpha subunit